MRVRLVGTIFSVLIAVFLSQFPMASCAELMEKSDVLLAKAKELFSDGMINNGKSIEKILNEVIRQKPQSTDAHLLLGRLYLWEIERDLRDSNDIFSVIDLADQAKDLDKSRPAGDYLRVFSLRYQGKIDEANILAEQIQYRFPHHVDTYWYLSQVMLNKDPVQSLQMVQKALASGASLDELTNVIVSGIKSTTPESLSVGEAIENFANLHPNKWLWHYAAHAFVQERKYSQAELLYKKAIDGGNNLESILQRGILRLNQLKNPQGATNDFENVIKNISEAVPVSTEAAIRGNLIIAQLQAGNIEAAVKETQFVFRNFLDEQDILQRILEEFKASQNLFLMHSILRQARLANPNLLFIYVELGKIAHENRDFDLSIREFTKGIAAGFRSDNVFAARAKAFYGKKSFQLALRDFDIAIRLSPTNAVYHYNRACMLALLGSKDQALKGLEIALNLDDSLAKLARTDADFESLRDSGPFQARLELLSDHKRTASAASSTGD